MPSFDIVSLYDMQELDNAVNMAKRDITNRYDLKGTKANIELNKSEKWTLSLLSFCIMTPGVS